MYWNEGHIWKFKLIISNVSSFEYKYVVLNHNLPETWETGSNRVLDLDDNENKKITVQDTFK